MKLFALIAGESPHTFSVGGIDFRAAPLTLSEQAGYYAALNAKSDSALFEYMAGRLRERVVGTNSEQREKITPEWFSDNVTGSALGIIIDLLLNGEHEKKALLERIQNLSPKNSLKI